MSINTVGFVCSDSTDVFAVLDLVYAALNKLQEEMRVPIVINEVRFFPPTLRSISLSFHIGHYNRLTNKRKNGTEFRDLYIHFNCDSDYKEAYVGEKIIFSFGYWGNSEKTMLGILDSMSTLGDCYYLADDSTEDWFNYTDTNLVRVSQ